MSKPKCPTCGKAAHNFSKVEALNCVPPRSVLKFGEYRIKRSYRDALYAAHPYYNAEEVVGSFLGYNPYFPSEDDWFLEKKGNPDMD